MSYLLEYSERLQKILQKLSKKDSKRYEIIWKKINEIADSENIEHYKNLRHPLNNFKAVHIDKSFVLIFRFDKNKNMISFEDFDHHDKIYLKRS